MSLDNQVMLQENADQSFSNPGGLQLLSFVVLISAHKQKLQAKIFILETTCSGVDLSYRWITTNSVALLSSRNQIQACHTSGVAEKGSLTCTLSLGGMKKSHQMTTQIHDTFGSWLTMSPSVSAWRGWSFDGRRSEAKTFPCSSYRVAIPLPVALRNPSWYVFAFLTMCFVYSTLKQLSLIPQHQSLKDSNLSILDTDLSGKAFARAILCQGTNACSMDLFSKE